jgi:hypothetical protein
MNTADRREWMFLDKSKWPYASKEPDKVQWRDQVTGLTCLIVRVNPGGALCGYVGVPPGHPPSIPSWLDRCLCEDRIAERGQSVVDLLESHDRHERLPQCPECLAWHDEGEDCVNGGGE